VFHPDTVISPDWIERSPNHPRIGSSESEQVHHVKLAASPKPTKADAFADGRVVGLGICRRRVEHDECGDAATTADRPAEKVDADLDLGDNVGRISSYAVKWPM
jgi:hypothetical protein